MWIIKIFLREESWLWLHTSFLSGFLNTVSMGCQLQMARRELEAANLWLSCLVIIRAVFVVVFVFWLNF